MLKQTDSTGTSWSPPVGSPSCCSAAEATRQLVSTKRIKASPNNQSRLLCLLRGRIDYGGRPETTGRLQRLIHTCPTQKTACDFGRHSRAYSNFSQKKFRAFSTLKEALTLSYISHDSHWCCAWKHIEVISKCRYRMKAIQSKTYVITCNQNVSLQVTGKVLSFCSVRIASDL